MTNDILNAETIASLRLLDSAGEPSIIVEIGNMLLQSFPENLNLIKAAAQNKNNETLKGLAHKTKSTFGNLGAFNMSKLLSELENSAEKNDSNSYIELIDRIEKEFHIVKNALEIEMKK